jgi:S-adenosylmethionine:tRNA ribosyltransferase-isomerase
MLVISRQRQSFHDDVFRNFNQYIRSGDCLVLNDTRVFPARLHGNRGTAAVEVFLLRALNPDETEWQVLVKPGKRARPGDEVVFSDHLRAQILSRGELGERTLQFSANQPVRALLDQLGETPLPPYIHRHPTPDDANRYQTVFARHRGSVAAPTAGLHFTPEIVESCRTAGAELAYLTLHVGLGTFAPIRANQIADIRLHEEYFEITEASAEKMRAARRLFCIGTTTVRTVETAMLRGGLSELKGETNLFISPGFHFRATGAMLTNFHLRGRAC